MENSGRVTVKVYTEEEKKALKAAAVELICPHFAHNQDLHKNPKIFIAGDGCYVWDIDGKKYLDSFASLLTTICGHNCKEVVDAVCEQVHNLEFFPNYTDSFSVEQVKLARKLEEICPGDLAVSFFVNSGSEANETALKMARQYHMLTGHPEKYKVIGRKGSYHGTTLGATAATGLKWFTENYEPMLGKCFYSAMAARCYDCPLDVRTCGMACYQDLEDIIIREGAGTISAIIMDPIPGSNTGYPLPPEGYMKKVRKLCDDNNILLIFDEVQTGFGKTGKMFATEHFGITPDIMALGKGISGGYIPLGAVVTTKKIYGVFSENSGCEFRSGSTYGGHNVACSAALAVINMIQKNGLVEHARKMGEHIDRRFEKLKKSKLVGGTYGIGLLKAVELLESSSPRKPIDPALHFGDYVRDYCYDRGVIVRNNGNILVLAPALIITAEQLDTVIDMMEEAINAAASHFGMER